jgi:hypothetical protein
MLRLIARAEQRLLSAHNFVLNVHFFWWVLGHKFRNAIAMARNTVPGK